MIIQCTKSLLDKIGIKGNELASSEGNEELPHSLMAWHANFVSIDRRKAIVLMNNETRYTVVIYRPSTKDFSKIKDLIVEAIREALRMEGIRKEAIEAYLTSAGEITFSKTASRSMVAKLNNAVRDLQCMWEYLDENTKIQRYISLVTGRMIQLEGKNPGFYPYERMLACLDKLYGQGDKKEILDVSLYQLKIKIDIEGHDIWRRVLVPSTYSFRHLHNIIQTVFDWHNSHLHEYVIDRENIKAIKILMDDDPEMMDYIDLEEMEILQERFIALEDIFPKYNQLTYEYDFGDSWRHIITFEKVVASKEFQPFYVNGAGERPPEDVGGEWGYEEYLQAIENQDHPEHESMKEWAESQKERTLIPEIMNKQLKHAIKSHQYTIYRL